MPRLVYLAHCIVKCVKMSTKPTKTRKIEICTCLAYIKGSTKEHNVKILILQTIHVSNTTNKHRTANTGRLNRQANKGG